MKHCSSCQNCISDIETLKKGFVRYVCSEFGYLITHPFFSGLDCIRYKKKKTWRDK